MASRPAGALPRSRESVICAPPRQVPDDEVRLAIRIRPPGRRLTARILDACRTACEAGDLEAASRLLRLGEALLGPRPDPLLASFRRGRGRPPRRHLAEWNEDAEAIVALHAALLSLRLRQQEQETQAHAARAGDAAAPAPFAVARPQF